MRMRAPNQPQPTPTAPTTNTNQLCAPTNRAQEEEKKQGSMSREEIERPNPECVAGMRHGTYDKLDEDGLVPAGAF